LFHLSAGISSSNVIMRSHFLLRLRLAMQKQLATRHRGRPAAAFSLHCAPALAIVCGASCGSALQGVSCTGSHGGLHCTIRRHT
jgi:hypothetical protein